MAEFGVGSQNPFNLLEVEPSPDDAVDEKPAGKSDKKNPKKENKAPAKKAAASEAPAAAVANPSKPKQRDRDRHVSGTGRGKEMQKGGAGRHNWGGADAADNIAAGDVVAEPPVESPAPDAAAAAGGDDADKQPTLGLEDYFKQLAAKRVEDDAKAAREVVDDENFKAIRVLDKDETDESVLFADLVQTKEKKSKGQKKKKKGVSLDEFVVKHGGPLEPRPRFVGDRDNRGGRGGFRGGRGRGGFGSPPGASAGVAAPAAADAGSAVPLPAQAQPAVAAPAAPQQQEAAPAAQPVGDASAPQFGGQQFNSDRSGYRGGRGGRGGRDRNDGGEYRGRGGGDYRGGGGGDYRGRGRGGSRGGEYRGRGRGGDFSRGGYGGPGAGGGRGGNNSTSRSSVDIASEDAFPALGSRK